MPEADADNNDQITASLADAAIKLSSGIVCVHHLENIVVRAGESLDTFQLRIIGGTRCAEIRKGAL